MADEPIDFEQVEDLLTQFGALHGAADLHGFLVGQLAGGRRPSRSEWLRSANEQADLSSNPDEVVGACLQSLYQQTLAALLDSDLEFALLLPQDDTELPVRVDCLGQWCQGFLVGFGLAGNTRTNDAELAETLRDLSAISQIGAEADDANEASSESDLFAICEYVRLSAIDIFWRYHQAAPDAAPSAPDRATPARLFQRDKLH